jgi:hypothetical protein
MKPVVGVGLLQAWVAFRTAVRCLLMPRTRPAKAKVSETPISTKK